MDFPEWLMQYERIFLKGNILWTPLLKGMEWKLKNETGKTNWSKIKTEEEVHYQDSTFSYLDDAF